MAPMQSRNFLFSHHCIIAILCILYRIFWECFDAWLLCTQAPRSVLCGCTFQCPTDSVQNLVIPLDSAGMAPESAGMGPESAGMTGLRRNGTRMAQFLWNDTRIHLKGL